MLPLAIASLAVRSPWSTARTHLSPWATRLRAPAPQLSSVTGPLSGPLPADFELPSGRSVILFDGVCNFCNAWVGFVLDNDPEGMFCFASLQVRRT